MIDMELFNHFLMFVPLTRDEIKSVRQIGPVELEVVTDDDTKFIYTGDEVYIEKDRSKENPRTKEEWQKEFSKRLFRAMRRRGYNQIDLANELGVSPVVVNGWINGKHLPRLDTAIQIAHMLDFPVSKLVDFW